MEVYVYCMGGAQKNNYFEPCVVGLRAVGESSLIPIPSVQEGEFAEVQTYKNTCNSSNLLIKPPGNGTSHLATSTR